MRDSRFTMGHLSAASTQSWEISIFTERRTKATVTPKLHMLEDHVVPFIRMWRVGLGMMGEQGAESIHSRFNTLGRTYSSMKNSVERLKSMVKDHYRQVFPANIVKQPLPQKRAKLSEE